MFSPAEPRNSSYDVTKVLEINPTVMDRIRGWGDKFRDFLSEKCCSCVATVPSFALVLLALVLVTLLIASLPLAFAITYWRPQALRSAELKPLSVSRLHNNFMFSNKFAAPLPRLAFKDYFPSNITSCKGFGFACASNPSRVIGTNLRCDGVMNCDDNSDEFDCRECQSSFSCKKSNRLICLRGSDLCNGISQCDDDSDETKHCRETCESDEYRCSNASKCIPDEWRCDGDSHCPNSDDETNCEVCNGGAKMCQSTKTCIPKWQLCNGVSDCEDGFDELDCDCKSCSSDFTVLCDGEKKMCMSIDKVCDGVRQCPNGEDEVNCAGACPATERIVAPEDEDAVANATAPVDSDMMKCHEKDERRFDWRYLCDGTAHHHDFLHGECDVPCTKCYTPFAFDCFHNKSASMDRSISINARDDVVMYSCISRSKVCDGINDCVNGADEFECGCPHPSAIRCGEGSDQCFRLSQKCDGTFDCDTQTDEKNCTKCASNTFHCVADQKCIPDRSMCDGVADCSDGADEKDCSCEQCMRHPMKMYHCEKSRRCFRDEDICTPYTACPNPTQRDKIFCAMRDRKALALL